MDFEKVTMKKVQHIQFFSNCFGSLCKLFSCSFQLYVQCMDGIETGHSEYCADVGSVPFVMTLSFFPCQGGPVGTENKKLSELTFTGTFCCVVVFFQRYLFL